MLSLKPISNPTPVAIFTDGACQPNPGAGGWAAVLEYGSAKKEISGFEPSSTNNRMELTALIKALECITRPSRIRVYTDSMILVGIVNGTGKKAHKRQNQDLVMRIIALIEDHHADAIWVKGHSGHPQNTRCDQLANEQIYANTKPMLATS